jgi:hypothetical protein
MGGPRSRRLTVRDPQRPPFAAPYCTWIARRSCSESDRSAPLSWQVQPDSVPPSAPRVARDQCVFAGHRIGPRRRENPCAPAGQLTVQHRTAVAPDPCSSPCSIHKWTPTASLARTRPQDQGRKHSVTTGGQHVEACCVHPAGPPRWRRTAEERSLVPGSRWVGLIMRSHRSLAAPGGRSGWRRQRRARPLRRARRCQKERPPFSDQFGGHGRGE